MISLKPEDRRTLNSYIGEFRSWFDRWLINPVNMAMGSVVSTELDEISQLLANIHNAVIPGPSEKIALGDDCAPLLKRILIFTRKRIAEQQERLRANTSNPDLHKSIDTLADPLNRIMDQEWYKQAEPLTLPTLTDFITLELAQKYSLLAAQGEFPARLDDKFRILQSSTKFLPALAYCRNEALVRGTDISVAFIDIDNFKSFNTKFTESVVDRIFLPRVMQIIEAHVYAHGWAYRFGGDEYLLLLPNTGIDPCILLVNDLRSRLNNLKIIGIEDRITVSTGLCTIRPDSSLTDLEVQDAANRAKAHAKKHLGKNCIATYRGTLYRDEDLFVVSIKRPSIDGGT